MIQGQKTSGQNLFSMGRYDFKRENILKHSVRCYHYFLQGDFDASVQNARKTTEAIAKAVLFRKKGESLGEGIIQGLKHPIQNEDIRTDPSPLTLNKLINVLTGNRYIDNGLKIRFDEIRYGGNLASHDLDEKNVLIEQNDAEVVKNDLYVILRWFFENIDKRPIPLQIEKAYQGDIDKNLISEEPSNWVEFYHECDQFNTVKNYYISIAPPSFNCSKYELSEIGKVPWKLVFDFDQKTHLEGGFYEETRHHRTDKIVSLKSLEDPADFMGESNLTVYWFAANGMVILGQEEAFIFEPIGRFRDWRNKYRNNLEAIIEAFLRSLSNKRVIIISFHDDLKYLDAFHDFFLSAPNARKRFKFIFTTSNEDTYKSITSDYKDESNVKAFQISHSQIANGISSYGPETKSETKARYGFPVPGKDPKTDEDKTIGLEHYQYLRFLKNGIEIIYKGIERDIPEKDLVKSFFAGNTINWQELANGAPVRRHDTSKITKEITDLLGAPRAVYRFNLYHAPGSGGTTLARTVAYELHGRYPTIVLRAYRRGNTASSIADLSDATQMPVLIIVESFEVNKDEQDRLLAELESKRRHVLLISIRQIWIPLNKPLRHAYYLMQRMHNDEIAKFEHKFSQLDIGVKRKFNIKRIRDEYPSSDISPFIYGLTAFEDDFLKLPEYISMVLFNDSLPERAKEIIGYVSMVYYYTQQSTSTSLLINTQAEEDSGLNLTLNERFGEDSPIHLLLIEETDIEGNNSGRWRPRHALFATEAMQQILVGRTGHKADWRDFLSEWVQRFIKLCGTNTTFLSKELYELLRSLLLVRDYSDAIGKEDKDDFSRCIEDIPRIEDRQMIFEELVNQFPSEPHFRIHLARFNYKITRDFKKAREQAEEARNLAQHDYNIHHTLGMCIRKEVEYMIEHDPEVHAKEEEIKKKATEASEAFRESRKINSNNIHAYISNMQLMISVLDYGLKVTNLPRSEFLTNKENIWYIQLYDELTELANSASYVFQQIEKSRQKGSADSDYYTFSKGLLKSCEIRKFRLVGDYNEAIERSKYMAQHEGISNRPFFRRLTVNLLLAKANRINDGKKEKKNETVGNIYKQWEKLTEDEIYLATELLEKNLLEEPSNSKNFRMWFNAIRHTPSPPSIKDCIRRINKWRDLSLDKKSTHEAIYYLYILNAVAAIESGESFSSHFSREAKHLIELSAKNEGNSNYSFEWYGKGEGVSRILNQSFIVFDRELGQRGGFREESQNQMERVVGTIKNIESRQAGTIILDCGLEAFFVPIAGDFAQEDALKSKVSCFISFRYDGLQAWDVKKISSQEEITQIKQRNIRAAQYELNTIDFLDEEGEPRIFKGVVKSLQNNTFGFIHCEELSQEVFFHKRNLEGCYIEDLEEQETVEFSCELNADSKPILSKGRFQAQTVWSLY